MTTRSEKSRSGRAKVACKACNSRRTRCDRGDSDCCTLCRNTSLPCELIDSRRGKYDRGNSQLLDRELPCNSQSSPIGHSKDQGRENIIKPHETNESSLPPTEQASLEQYIDEKDGNKNGAEMLFARLADPIQPSPKSLQKPVHPRERRTVYLGESYNLSYVIEQFCGTLSSSGHKILHHPVPNNIDDRTSNLPRDVTLEREEMNCLVRKGAFMKPEKLVCDRLVRAYFERVHPSWPIFDKAEFAQLYASNRVPILTLQTVFLMSATHCDERTIREAGFTSRYMARLSFYNRAKALYDADYETDTTTIIQALFFLGFWCGSPIDQKETWHWLGAAVSLAQATGMHRTTMHANLNPDISLLWKKIWWCIYIRDIHAAAALGRPPHIQDEFCDVEMPHESDFNEMAMEGTSYGMLSEEHVMYFVHMTKLSVQMSKVLRIEFLPNRPPNEEIERAKLAEEFRAWESSLPVELTYHTFGVDMKNGIGSLMLHITYNNYLILLHRPRFTRPLTSTTESSDSIAFNASVKISRMVEDLLTVGILSCAQIHIISSIFAALTILIQTMQRTDSIQRELAEHRARLCMLALGKFQDQWPVAGWVLKLFDRLMEEMRSHNRRPIVPSQERLKRGPPQDSNDPNKRRRNHRGAVPSNAPDIQSLEYQEDYRHFGSLDSMGGYMNPDYHDSMVSPEFSQDTMSTDFGMVGNNTYFTLLQEEGGQQGYPLLDEVFAWAI